MTRIFVSSTCYDLLDLRAETKRLLEAEGLQPVMSDDIDNFDVSGRAESIETCLVNVRTSDAFVCVLSQRYGPSLKKTGYDDISATHLEYREARKHNLPIYVFVRDRLDAEFALSQKHRKAHGSLDGFQTQWVPSNSHQIFEFLDEHSKLVKGAASTNWYTSFSTSVDLKERLQKLLATMSSRALLTRLLDSAALPILTLTPAHFRAAELNGVIVENLSAVPALDLAVTIVASNDFAQTRYGDLASGSRKEIGLTPGYASLPLSLHVTFTTPTGYRIAQDFVYENQRYIRSTIRLRDRGGFQIG